MILENCVGDFDEFLVVPVNSTNDAESAFPFLALKSCRGFLSYDLEILLDGDFQIVEP